MRGVLNGGKRSENEVSHVTNSIKGEDMKGRVKKRGLTEANRALTGILAAAIVMSNLSGTGLVVHAEEIEIETIETGTEVENRSESETEEAITEEAGSVEESEPEEASTDEETEPEEASTDEELEIEEVSGVEELSSEELQSEEIVEEIKETEESLQESVTGEEALFASVYLQFDANGGNCDISMLELTPEHMELELPKADKAGYRFLGWFMDEACISAFDESNIFWEAGSSYVLYAGYEQLELDELTLVERTLQKSMNGVTITVEGNMPAEATLEVSVDELTPNEQEKLIQESDLVATPEELDTEQNTSYSYDITISYQGVEYEPYLFDEMMQVTFSFDDMQEVKDAQQMEVFHIDDNENVEKIEIKEVSENEVIFDADSFSTYILITQVNYTGNKNWNYGFSGGVQTFTAPVAGEYTFECYGAGTANSKGGFAKGTIGLKKNETVYIYVGGQNNTFNGGGVGGAVWHSASNTEGSFSQNVSADNGCGATDVRLGTGLETRVVVAGGGAGNGNKGGVNYSYNGSEVSGGYFYESVLAANEVSSNNTLGQGSGYHTWVTSGDWGSGSYPKHGTYSYRTVTGGGGGGYYGGNSGYAGTSGINGTVTYQGRQYQTKNTVIENLVYEGNGTCKISLYSLEADVISYYNYNMNKMGEAAGLAGSYVNFPAISETPKRASDSKYDYTFLGWDDMATEEIEYYTNEQTVAAALNGDRNYIAAYEEKGKSYAVTLDSADAQNAGTTNIMATYHCVLPDITIPVKEGAIFAGYYTGLNGSGTQIYSAEGKGMTLSLFDEETVIYAHWVQPIANIKNPESKEVMAGYAGVILNTEAELNPAIGYTLSYQWYMNHENSNVGGSPVEAADSKKLVIPQGFSIGNYYFYCLVTATSVWNGQTVSLLTEPAIVSVEKGIMGMEQVEVENETCTYDGTPKELEAAINNSNEHVIYYGTEPLSAENYLTKGTTIPNTYTDAGTYTNYIYVTGQDFVDFSGSISMTIHKAEPKVFLSSKNTAYNGFNQMVDEARVYGVNDQKMDIVVAYVYYMDEACTQKTDYSCGALEEGGAPSAVGTYYVQAVTQETTNYHAAATLTPAMFNILGTNVKYSISGFHGLYDGKPHGLQIMNEDETNAAIYFSDRTELTSQNYQTEGTVNPYEYTEVGNYPVYYVVVTKLAGGIHQYESGMAEIIIEPAKTTTDIPESNPDMDGTDGAEGTDSNAGSDGNENDSGNHNDAGGSSSGTGNAGQDGSSSGNGNAGQDETHKNHVHNYELITFEAPTTSQEGKALYRCKECGHELVIAYPVLEDDKKQEDSESILETEEKNSEIAENEKGQKSKQEEKDKKKTELSEKDNMEKLASSTETLEMNEHKELSEAELYKIAQLLEGLTEDQVRELYGKGLLNMTQEELERLLAILRTQIIIQEEEVSLSENTPLTDEDTEQVEAGKTSGVVWNVFWAFLLGAAVMYLIRKIMETKNTKKPKKEEAKTRKLN